MHLLPKQLVSAVAVLGLLLSTWQSVTHVHSDPVEVVSDSSASAVVGSANGLCSCGHHHSATPSTSSTDEHHDSGSPDPEHCSICRLVFESAANFSFDIFLPGISVCEMLPVGDADALSPAFNQPLSDAWATNRLNTRQLFFFH